MQPKTKLQKRVAMLSGFLPEITADQRKYALDKCFDHYGYRTSKQTVCMDCGKSFWTFYSENRCVCPSCESELRIHDTKKRSDSQVRYFCILDRYSEFQVIRFFYITKKSKKGIASEYDFLECVQHWISPDGKSVTMAYIRKMFGVDGWNAYSSFEVRRCVHYCHLINPDIIWKKKRIIPTLKRNGFKGFFYGINPFDIFKRLLCDNNAELLLKTGQISFFKYICSRNFDYDDYAKFWPSIKICIRNNYIIPDPDTWIDHFNTLVCLGKDIRNPKYICPENLHSAHLHYTEKLREQRRKIEIEEQKKVIDKEQKKYEKQKKKFFDIKISDGNIDIVVLDHVREFLIEGDIMQHCVFTNEYYKKQNSLILSARKGDQRLETIEVDLKKLEVIQSRGLLNESTEFHDSIVELVNNNMSQIRKRKRIKTAYNFGNIGIGAEVKHA